MILITGAAGKTGRAVIKALGRRQTAVRVWVRRQDQVDELRSLGVQEVIVGDVLDTAVSHTSGTEEDRRVRALLSFKGQSHDAVYKFAVVDFHGNSHQLQDAFGHVFREAAEGFFPFFLGRP